MAKKTSKKPTKDEIMKLVKLDEKIATLQMEKEALKQELYERYGDVEVVYELPRATAEGHKYLRLTTGLQVIEKIQASYTFLKKEPEQGIDG